MSGSWRRSFNDLPPDAIQILRVMTVLGITDVAAGELAAVVPLGLPEATTAVDALRRAGWVCRSEPSAERLADDARRWLADTAASTAPAAQTAALAGRLAEYQLTGLDAGQRGTGEAARWAGDHRAEILVAIRAASAAQLHTVAMRVAATAWQVAGPVEDPTWCRELAHHGEDAAIQGKDPVTLITLLDLSAAVFANAQDEAMAERQWVRALKLADELGDHERTTAALTALSVLYRNWDRLDKALDTLVDLVDEYQQADRPILLAGALTEVGATMLAADRPVDAPTYLARADSLLTEAPPADVPPVLHARVLELWGRALWSTDQHGPARRRFHRALAMLVDVDEPAADRVRALLATDASAPLPTDEPREPG